MFFYGFCTEFLVDNAPQVGPRSFPDAAILAVGLHQARVQDPSLFLIGDEHFA